MKLKKLCAALSALCMAVIPLTVAGCSGVSNAELNKKNEQLQEQIEKLQKELQELQGNSYKGTFYSLKYAFDNGFISEEQIQSVAYHAYGKVYTVAPDEENWENSEKWVEKKLTYVSDATLSEDAERYIKYAYYNKDFTLREYGATIDDLELKYYGRYNGKYYVVTIDSDFWEYPGEAVIRRYGNTLLFDSGPYFEVFVAE